MRRNVPPETTASAQARADAAVGWFDAATLESLLSPHTLQNWTLMQCLQSGSVLGVWIAERKLFLFPPWQLDSSGLPLAGLSEVLALLRGPMASQLAKGRQAGMKSNG